MSLTVLLVERHSYALSILTAIFSRWSWVSRYQNVSIRDFIGAKDDGQIQNAYT